MEWKKFKKKGICLILHEHADLDALSSAIALQSFLTRIYNIKARICAKSLNSLAKFYAKEHDVNVTIVDEKLRCDVAVLIDVASLVQVGFELDANILVVFDHHANNDVPADYKFVKMYSSTGRVIYEYIGEVNAYESYHLLAALLYDTSFLRYADIEDLDVVRILLKISKSTLNDFWFIREHALTVEKEAKKFMVQAIENAYVLSIRGKKVVVSKVGSYESKVASMFLQIGFDAAFVVVERKQGMGISCRFNDKAFSKDEINKIMKKFADLSGFKCGGHVFVFYCKCARRHKYDKIFNILKKAMV